MDIKTEAFSRLEPPTIEVMGTQDKRPGALGKAARPVRLATGLKDPSIRALHLVLISATVWRAGNLAENAP